MFATVLTHSNLRPSLGKWMMQPYFHTFTSWGKWTYWVHIFSPLLVGGNEWYEHTFSHSVAGKVNMKWPYFNTFTGRENERQRPSFLTFTGRKKSKVTTILSHLYWPAEMKMPHIFSQLEEEWWRMQLHFYLYSWVGAWSNPIVEESPIALSYSQFYKFILRRETMRVGKFDSDWKLKACPVGMLS